MSNCINLIAFWFDREPGTRCEYCEQLKCVCELGEGANLDDADF